MENQRAWMYCAGPAAAFAAPILPHDDGAIRRSGAARGEPPEARETPSFDARGAPALSPSERLAHSCLKHGRAASEEGQHEEALAWFERALVLAPHLGIAQFCRAMTLADLGRADEAADALEASLGREADDAPARIQFARLCARHGHYDAAIRLLGPALSANPRLADRVANERDFRALRDHPFFLQMVGVI